MALMPCNKEDPSLKLWVAHTKAAANQQRHENEAASRQETAKKNFDAELYLDRLDLTATPMALDCNQPSPLGAPKSAPIHITHAPKTSECSATDRQARRLAERLLELAKSR